MSLNVGENRVGIVVIGRNEGKRLQSALESATAASNSCVYVDSGSTDGSAETARSWGVKVHELDAGRPFSAARARREGVESLLECFANVEFVQFLDGDCELEPGWISTAVAQLDGNAQAAIVCGHVREADPQSSVYNRSSPLRWQLPTGDIDACGGIFMIRREVYLDVGGFHPELMTREERELCVRVRQAGHSVVRVDAAMAAHDSGLLRFGQWWARAVWGGYGDALGISFQPQLPDSKRLLRWYLTRPIATTVAALAGLIAANWWLGWLVLPLLSLILQAALVMRIAWARLRSGDRTPEAMVYALLYTLRNFACCWGFLKYYFTGGSRSLRPDPHARAVEAAT